MFPKIYEIGWQVVNIKVNKRVKKIHFIYSFIFVCQFDTIVDFYGAGE